MNSIDDIIKQLERERELLKLSKTYESQQELNEVNMKLCDLYQQQVEELKRKLGI